MKNTLRVHFSFEGRNKKAATPHKREEDAETNFIARPPRTAKARLHHHDVAELQRA